MRNLTGNVVEGDDFFERPRDLARFRRELDNGGNLLLVAPRRVGKTSFALRLCETLRGAGWSAAAINVEACEHEVDFAQLLIEAMRQAGLDANWWNRATALLAAVRKSLGKVSLGSVIDLDLGESADPTRGSLRQFLSSAFQQIEAGNRPALIAIDELPELLLHMKRQPDGPVRVEHLLKWLRWLRQSFHKSVHWIFLGSIGLDSFVEEHNLGKTVNDLTHMTLEPLTPDEAHVFLERLGAGARLSLDRPMRDAILQRIGWPIPYFLQILFHALVDLDRRPVKPADVDEAYNHLLSPESFGYFDTWRQRLETQFTAADAAACRTLLTATCAVPQGLPRERLLDALMAAAPAADPAEVELRLARLLLVLQRDGYLISQNGQYAFRSFLLRD
ncbi:MAG: ATP-binding protein, partial [Planctomycetaceae bacterium]